MKPQATPSFSFSRNGRIITCWFNNHPQKTSEGKEQFMSFTRQLPIRIQRKRTKGWKLPPNTICVNRPSKYGNPFKVGEKWIQEDGTEIILTHEQACNLYDQSIHFYHKPVSIYEIRRDLRGKNLACFCSILNKIGEYNDCHVDVLLSLANGIPINEIKNENLRQEKLLQTKRV